jgi:hypothetical protein
VGKRGARDRQRAPVRVERYVEELLAGQVGAPGESAVPWGTSRTMTDFDVGVLLPSAVLSSGTSTLVSGK